MRLSSNWIHLQGGGKSIKAANLQRGEKQMVIFKSRTPAKARQRSRAPARVTKKQKQKVNPLSYLQEMRESNRLN